MSGSPHCLECVLFGGLFLQRSLSKSIFLGYHVRLCSQRFIKLFSGQYFCVLQSHDIRSVQQPHFLGLMFLQEIHTFDFILLKQTGNCITFANQPRVKTRYFLLFYLVTTDSEIFFSPSSSSPVLGK